MTDSGETLPNAALTQVRRFRTNLKILYGLPPLVAAIDIFFLTLFFFMLSSSFVQVSGIKVDLPQTVSTVQADIEKFIVTIAWTPEGTQLFFNDRPMTKETLKESLAKVGGISKSAMIVIRPDRRVPFEPVAEVMALAEKANLASFIAVMPVRPNAETVFNPEK